MISKHNLISLILDQAKLIKLPTSLITWSNKKLNTKTISDEKSNNTVCQKLPKYINFNKYFGRKYLNVFFFEDIQFTAFPTDQICSCSTLLFPGVAVGINLLAPVSNLPNHIPVNNREMFLLAIPSDRNLKIHTLSNAFFNLPILSSTSSSLICICLIFFQLAGREILKQHYHLNGGLYQLQSVSDITIQLFLLLFIHSLIQFAMVLRVFSLLCLFSCFVCGQRFQIPHRGPESRCLVQWLRRQSCKKYLLFRKISKIRKTLRASHSQPSRTFEI